MENKKIQQNANKFNCEKCDFNCSKPSDWARHIARASHLLEKKGTLGDANYNCSNCSKNYKYSAGLWKHKKTCKAAVIADPIIPAEPIIPAFEKPYQLYNNQPPEYLLNTVDLLIKENMDFKNVILELVKSNQELQKQMLEVCKNGQGSHNTNHSNNNSNNKTFNLQFFLNEQCKDAMNLSDFVDTFHLEFADLENVGKVGYVEGISDIIIKKLNEMDVYKRPIHCSDFKRDIVYVKADNVWEKEDSKHAKLRKAIKQISKKNYDMIPEWTRANPNSQKCDHYMNDYYMSMVSNALGLRGGGLEENENKIMKKINKMVLIDK